MTILQVHRSHDMKHSSSLEECDKGPKILWNKGIKKITEANNYGINLKFQDIYPIQINIVLISAQKHIVGNH